MRTLALFAALLALAACDSGGDTGPAPISGRYVGVRPPGVPPQAVTYTLDLVEGASGGVGGSGTQANEKGTVAITVSGTRAGSLARLAIRWPAAPAVPPDSFVATVSGDASQLAGTIFGRAFGPVPIPLTLTRTSAAP